MKPRQTLMLALVLIVLAGIAGLVEANKKRQRAPQGNAVFPAFKLDKADVVEVSGKGQNIRLEKKDGQWMVATEGGFPADQKNANDLLGKIGQFKSTDVVATRKENHAVFEVDSTGIEVKVSAGGKVTADFMVGKPGPDFMSSYVRPVDKDEVYRVPVYLPSVVDKGGDTWRNKTIVEADKEKITGWTTKNGSETVAVERDANGAWKITQPFEAPARPDIISIVLDSLTRIRSVGFADSVSDRLASVGLEPDTMSIEIRVEGEKPQHVTIGTANARSQSYTKREGENVVYLVPKGRWTTIFRPSATLRAETTDSATPASEAPPVQLGGPSGH